MGKRKIRFFSRGALWRLGFLFLLGAGFFLWGFLAMIWMPGRSHKGPLPALTSEETASRGRLKESVEILALQIGVRNLYRPKALEAAAEWISEELRAIAGAVEREEFEAQGQRFRNLVAVIPGGGLKDEIVVVGAHYDTVPGTPGANDNGTGVAALLEIGRELLGASPERTVRLVAFVNEEPPFFQTPGMGSLVHAKAAKARGDRITAMISLETLGCYRDAPGSQHYPPPFSLFYPDTGNFVAFVGCISSRSLVREVVGTFRRSVQFPSEGAALPGWIPGVGWSDHWSFWQAGYPALMATDTAPFRYVHYHGAEDTPDKVDFDRLARVTAGLAKVVKRLAGS